MSPAERWLRARLAGAPENLLECMTGALPPHADSVPEAFAAGARHLYAGVLRGSGGREAALPLLAADALYTHAVEAQAEADPAAIPALVREMGGEGPLGALAAEQPTADPSPHHTPPTR